ncbi:MAG: hypothetical protein KAI03_05660 [Candidatus Aureabacteria bacterium]|nr:hypothetical protein [Candidatus Auribacterota bacterium]
MKKRYFFFIVPILSILLLFATGCSAPLKAPIVPPCGIFYTHIKAPCSTKYKETRVGGRTYGASFAQYLKEPFFGTSYGWGDASIQKIAEQNGIKKIEYVDYEYLNVFGIYQQLKIIPHGQ